MKGGTTTASAEYLKSRWDAAVADTMSPVERLVYRSNLLGADARITNTGGGNTSSKITEPDPVTGEPREVLWVKGSGGDLRTATKANFASLDLNQLKALQAVYARFDARGPKTPAEDTMVGMYAHTTFNRNATAPSIDTPLHGYVPFKHVDHMHPVAVIAIATAEDGPALTREVYGDDVIWTDWQRPGFELGLELERICRDHPNAKGVILGAHGLINWANDDRECYELTLDLIRRAHDYLESHDNGKPTFGGAKYETLTEPQRVALLTELLPWIRGKVSTEQRLIGTVESRPEVLDYINSNEAPRLAELGTSCPDHFLRTKIKPLYVAWNPQKDSKEALYAALETGLAKYQTDYREYYETHKHPNSPAVRVSAPSVILIPGVGMIAWGKSKSESRVTAEFYTAAIHVMRGAERVSKYTALPRQEAFDIEYWLLEEAKLKRMPPEKALDRQIAVVVGAGSGIGKAVASALLAQGATVAAIDLHESAAKETASEILDKVGMGIGVAGTGISGAGQIIGLSADMTNRESIRAALAEVVMAFGGVDHLIVTAGYYPTPDPSGALGDNEFDKAFAINVKGPFLAADEAWKIWKVQGLKGSMVITTSVNAVVVKSGSFAYDTSKAAADHLVRELALAYAPRVRVNGVAPATVLEGSSMFPRDRVMASLAKYNVAFNESDTTEQLRDKLSQFYAKRTLTQTPIMLRDQVKAIVAFVTDDFSKTTGQIVNVDGGLVDAFRR